MLLERCYRKVIEAVINGKNFSFFFLEKQEHPEASSSNCTCRINYFTYFAEMLTTDVKKKRDMLDDCWCC